MVRQITPALTIREARIADCYDVVDDLRPIDKYEARIVHGVRPLEGLLRGVQSGRAYTLLSDGKPIALGGVVLESLWHGCPWLVGTPELTKFGRHLHREARRFLDQYRDIALMNSMLASNTVHRRWVERLGFKVTHTYTVRREEVIHFVHPGSSSSPRHVGG